MDKHQRYRRKCLSEGRCPHCGKQAAPYVECEERRLQKRVHYALTRLYRVGLAQRVGRGVYKSTEDEQFAVFIAKASGRKGDKRLLPKLGDKPFQPDNLIMSLAHSIALKSPDRTVTEKQVAAAFAKVRLKRKRR